MIDNQTTAAIGDGGIMTAAQEVGVVATDVAAISIIYSWAMARR